MKKTVLSCTNWASTSVASYRSPSTPTTTLKSPFLAFGASSLMLRQEVDYRMLWMFSWITPCSFGFSVNFPLPKFSKKHRNLHQPDFLGMIVMAA